MNWVGAFRGYFARQEDPYAGGDLQNARTIGIVIWGLLLVLYAALLPFSPPTATIGAAGWAVAAALLGAGVATIYLMRVGRLGGWGRLLAVASATAVGIGIAQWLCGGLVAPFRGLLLLPVLFVAATQPPRRIAAFLGLVLLIQLSPFIYDTWDGNRAQGTVATFVIWCALSLGVSLQMMGVRAQRLTLQAEGEEARAEARVDSLTGLRNRRAFEEMLIVEVARARRLELPLSVAMVDIVDFKQVNDRWSHAEGDRCLREVAEALRDNVRQPDLCFRWGGDEFALILTGTTVGDTEPVARRLHQEIGRACARPDDTPVRIRFAVAELEDGMAPSDLRERAALALTGVKLDGSGAPSGRSAAQTTNATSST